MRKDLWIGAHVSAAGGVENAPLNARQIKAEAFGLFTKNQRQWTANPLSSKNIDGFRENCKKLGYTPDRILPHASYLINLGHPEYEARSKSMRALLDELQRCEQLGIRMLNVHPGSHLGEISESRCLSLIAASINQLLDRSRDVTVVIENTAGQGNSVGYRLEHLAEIIEQVEDRERVGACIDTCHAFAAGYDLSSAAGAVELLDAFEETVGLKYLAGMHMNDSKKERGSRVDRHDIIGKGLMGTDGFRALLRDPRTRKKPLILETPNREHWDEEIAMLYNMAEP